MWDILKYAAETTLEITLIIFILMVAVDFLDVRFHGHLKNFIHTRPLRQWIVAAFLGATPGCAGAYANATMYMHGFISVGALTAGMIATTGDEAFVMLAEFPLLALSLTVGLLALGIFSAAFLDKSVQKIGYTSCEDCTLHTIHDQDKHHDWAHYFKVHIWKHIFLGHALKIAAWTFISVALIEWTMTRFPLQAFLENQPAMIFLFAILIGLLPISGPHLVFISLFNGGLIPFSVLLVNSIVQDGHAMLPMLSYSIRDVILIKAYKIMLAVIFGGLLFLIGF